MSNVLILGASSAMARQTANRLAARGDRLLLAGRNVRELERLAADLRIRYRCEALAAAFDARDYAGHSAFIDRCEERAGPLDGIVLAFGLMSGQQEAQADFDLARSVIETNYLAAVSVLEMIAARFERRRQGFICAISSVAGDRGRQSNYIYGSSKGALSLYLQGLRNRLHPAGVPVLTVKPGFVDTRMTFGLLKDSPLVADPDRVAAAIVRALDRRRNVVYAPGFWAVIMRIIKLVPEPIFKRLKL